MWKHDRDGAPPLAEPATLYNRPRPLLKWSFLLFAATIILNLNGLLAMGARTGQVFTLILFGLSIVILLAGGISPKRDLEITGLAYFVFLAGYVAFGSLARTFEAGTYSYTHQLWMLSAGVLTVYVSAVASRRMLLSGRAGELVGWLAAISCCATAFILIDFMWPAMYEYIPRVSEDRHSGLYKNPNEAGTMGNIAAMFCLAGMLCTRRPLWCVAGMVICGLSIVLTFSRTSIIIYVTLIGAVGSLLLFARSRRWRLARAARRRVVVIAAVIAIGVFAWFIAYGVRFVGDLRDTQQSRIDTVTDLAQGRNIDEALANRLPVFQLAVDYWLRSPLVGNGLGVGTAMDHPEGRIGTHNTWLLILVDTGPLPVLLFLGFGLIWFAQALRCELPGVRVVALGYFLIFALTILSSHNTLTKRVENLALGITIGLMAGDKQLRRRRALGGRS